MPPPPASYRRGQEDVAGSVALMPVPTKRRGVPPDEDCGEYTAKHGGATAQAP